jgi:hypothetical protein
MPSHKQARAGWLIQRADVDVLETTVDSSLMLITHASRFTPNKKLLVPLILHHETSAYE